MTGPVIPKEQQDPGNTFNPNDYDWYSHLSTALKELPEKAIGLDRDWNYYEGKQPKVWLTDAIRDQLDTELVTNMAENWIDTAVDAPIKRLWCDGFNVALKQGAEGEKNDLEATEALNVWDDNQLDLGQKEIYTAARCTGESFVIAWKDDELEHGISVAIQDGRNIWWPKDAHRSKPVRVVKVWADTDEKIWRATCYYKYVVVRLRGPRIRDDGTLVMPQPRWFEPDSVDPGGPHGFDEVPVFRFAVDLKRRSLVDSLRSFQDKINKLAANMMVNAEFNAYRKMAILSKQSISDNDLRARPNRIWHLDPGGGEDGEAPTSIWEGSATDLENYSKEQDKLIDKLFTKAGLPGHLKVKSEREVPSGAAYEADEGPFTEMILSMQRHFGATWKDFYEVVLGIDVDPQWTNPHIRSDRDEMETVKLAKDAGVPLELALKKYGSWTKPELDELADAPLSTGEQLQMAMAQDMIAGGPGVAAQQQQEQANDRNGPRGKPPRASGAGRTPPFRR